LKQTPKSRQSVDDYAKGILRRDRIILAKAITLIESTLPSDQRLASELIEKILPSTGNSIRIGITGSPGVGKSTFIEAFGKYLTDIGKKVAVLTIDPSSQRSKGSILGDKTRMAELAVNPNAFIRPSSSGDALGGVAHKTRESMLLCEAGGYEIILIETVGVGQSEVIVKSMTDFFLLLMLPGSGDELQGIKKGIMEMADLVVITKADGETLKKARQSQAEFQQALNLLYHFSEWVPKVVTCSALTGEGIAAVFDTISDVIERRRQTGEFANARTEQNINYMHEYFSELLRARIEALKEKVNLLQGEVVAQRLSPSEAGRQLLAAFLAELQGSKSTK
jgi:LAO/AO transport system kinase